MKTVAEYVEGVLAEIKKRNPYPESVFIEPTKEEYRMVREMFKKNGLCLTAYSGAWGRKVWNNCIEEVMLVLLGEEGD